MNHRQIPTPDSRQRGPVDSLDDEYATPDMAVGAAVAAVEGIETSSVDPPLYESIDADALRALVDHGDGDWHLAFDLGEHSVVVHSDGSVVVDDTTFRDAFVA